MYIYDYFNVIAGSILVAMYACVFAFVMRGSKNTWVLKVTIMLLVSSIGTTFFGLALYETANDTRNTPPLVYLLCISLFLKSSMFGASHFLLAMKTKQMSENVPALLDGKKPEKSTTCHPTCGVMAFGTVLVL